MLGAGAAPGGAEHRQNLFRWYRKLRPMCLDTLLSLSGCSAAEAMAGTLGSKATRHWRPARSANNAELSPRRPLQSPADARASLNVILF